MTATQLSKIATLKNVASFLNETKADLCFDEELVNKLDCFLEQFYEFRQESDEYQNLFEKYSAEHKHAFDALSAHLVSICKTAFLWAKEQQHHTLKISFRISPLILKYKPPKEVVAMSKHLYRLIDIHKVPLKAVGITQLQINQLEQLIDQYEQQSKPNEMIRDGRLYISKKIALIESQINIIKQLFASSVSDYPTEKKMLLHQQFLNAFQPVHLQKTTGLRVRFKDAINQHPVLGAIVDIVPIKKRAISNREGIAEIIKMQFGTYNIQFFAKEYALQQQVYKIERGKLLEIEVFLQKSSFTNG